MILWLSEILSFWFFFFLLLLLKNFFGKKKKRKRKKRPVKIGDFDLVEMLNENWFRKFRKKVRKLGKTFKCVEQSLQYCDKITKTTYNLLFIGINLKKPVRKSPIILKNSSAPPLKSKNRLPCPTRYPTDLWGRCHCNSPCWSPPRFVLGPFWLNFHPSLNSIKLIQYFTTVLVTFLNTK